MVSSITLLTALLVGASTIAASPALVSRAGVTTLSGPEILAYEPYAKLARAAYCSSAQLQTWTCGTACNDLSGMTDITTGGGGLVDSLRAKWYVGYYPPLNTIVVSNQGADASELSSLFDVAFIPTSLNPGLFPGVPSNVRVHAGFQINQASGASAKLAAVKALIAKYPSASTTCTGLGHGGAIAFLDALHFLLHIPEPKIKVVTHGMPRVGNQEFANYFDNHLNDVSRITNRKDIIPILPGRFLGFHHSQGEKHILARGVWVACAGQENTDAQCIAGAVPNVLAGDIEDHPGPYNDIMIDGGACN
ncbi:Alpha/Beta hydrolase protein [Rhizoctonia solani]|nr:Alpha/Beta hydrolase protein [Rhizoctonia solani]